MKSIFQFILIFIIASPVSLFSQINEIIVRPKKDKGWTGSIRYLDGVYDRFDSEIRVGKGSFYCFFRGFSVFDISKIPDNAIINSVKLHVIANTDIRNESSIHILNIVKLPVDPRSATEEELFFALNNNIFLALEGSYMTKSGEQVIELNNKANDVLKSYLTRDWWAIGFREHNDGKDSHRSMGVFEGYNYSNGTFPYCEVTYIVTDEEFGNLQTTANNLRSDFQGRNISYISKLLLFNENITISIWDHMKVDGDVISIYLNGQSVVSNYFLEKKKKVISVILEPDKLNELFLYAHNLGEVAPNTVAIEITDDNKKNYFILNSDLNSCEGVVIKVEY